MLRRHPNLQQRETSYWGKTSVARTATSPQRWPVFVRSCVGSTTTNHNKGLKYTRKNHIHHNKLHNTNLLATAPCVRMSARVPDDKDDTNHAVAGGLNDPIADNIIV